MSSSEKENLINKDNIIDLPRPKRVNPKESLNAKNVARDVIKNMRKGQKIVIGKLMRKNGYAESVAVRPQKVTKTKTFQKIMSNFIEELEQERAMALLEMRKKRQKAKYRDLTDSIDKLTKNIRLLSGKSTENLGAVIYLPSKNKKEESEDNEIQS